MKTTLLFLAVMCCNLSIFSQNPTLNITQPTCSSPYGTAQVTSPLSGYSPIASNLYISEVTDAALGSLSYIEIFNGTGATVNLSNYKLKIFSNGSSTASCDLSLSGSVNNYSVFVVAVGSTTNLGGVIPNQTFASCIGFNTNDAVILATSSNVAIDLWGSTTGTVFTPLGQAGYTYRRHIDATVPSLTFIPTDWTALDPEDYTNVGSYSTSADYQYSIDNGPFQFSTVFTQLVAGNHVIKAQNLVTGVSTETSFDIIVAVPTNPVTDFVYQSPICQNNSVVIPNKATGFTVGGIFSCSTLPSLNPNNGAFITSQVPPGNHLITYIVSSNSATCLNGGSSIFNLIIQPVSNMPQGPTDQTLTIPNATISNLVISPTNVTWYMSLTDALNNTNHLFNTTPLVDGATYYAVNNFNGCPSNPYPVTVHFNLSTSAFNDFNFQIIPNPATATINIQTPKEVTIDKISISDLSGKTILFQTTFNNNQVNLAQLSAGIYLIEVYSGERKFQTKFIKE